MLEAGQLAQLVPGVLDVPRRPDVNDLAALDYCEVTPAENEEILILLTDTPDENSEKALQKKLKTLKSLESLGMTFGHTDE